MHLKILLILQKSLVLLIISSKGWAHTHYELLSRSAKSLFFSKVLVLQKISGGKNGDSNFQLQLERIPEPPYFEKSIIEFLSFLVIFWQLFTLPCVLHTVSNISSEKHSGMKVRFIYVFLELRFLFNVNFPRNLIKIFLDLL